MKIKRGSTSVRRLIFIGDSSSTVGAGLTGLVYNTSGLVAYYFAGDLSNELPITLAPATLGTYTDGGFVEVDATNMPGWYEVGFPNTALDGGNEVAIQFRGAANMVPVNIYVELDTVDYQTAAFGAMASYTQPTGFLAATFPTTVASTTNITGATGVVLSGVTHTGAVIPTVTTLTGHTAQTGDSFARIGATGSGLTSLATAAQINSLQVNTRANIQVPIEIETPDASTQVYKIRLFLFDVEGNMEAPDATPTVTLVSAGGIDRSARLSVASNPATGVYSWDYTATAGDTEEQLVWTFTVVEGSLTRIYPATSYVVEETAYRFSSADRATLNATATQASVDDLPTNAELATALAAADDATLAAIAAEGIKTAAIQTKTDQMVFTVANKVDATATATIDAADIRAALGMSAADLDDQLDAILAAANASAGSGARTVTITVDDGTDVLQNARVRLTEGASTYTALTNVSGVATFNVDDASYAVSITKAGYAYAGTTLVVDGTEAVTYSMTLVVVTPPADPLLSAIEVLCLGADFTAEADIDIDFRIVTVPSGDENKAYRGTKVTVASNVSGVARWEAPRNSVVEFKRGSSVVWQRATLDNDDATSVTSIIGSP